MPDKTISSSFKEHPIAIILCVVYTLLWLSIGFFGLYQFKNRGDSTLTGVVFSGFVLIVLLPYLLTTIAVAVFSTKSKKFYWDMVGFILVFILVAALIGVLVYYING